MGTPRIETVAEGLDHPEGVALGPDGNLYAGGEAGQIYRVSPDGGGFEEIANTGGFVLGLALDADCAVYVCDFGSAAILRADRGGEVSVYCDRADGAPLVTPNWLVFAEDGTLFFSDSGREDPDAFEGRLIRVPPGGGEGEVLGLPPLSFANGLALAPNGDLYVIESFQSRVSVVRDGRVEPYAELPGLIPDGCALDEEGGLIVSCYQPNRILRIPPGGGEAELVVDDWTGIHLLVPTNVAFFGPDRRRLAIALLGGWAIRAIDVPWAGQPLFYPRLDTRA